MTIEPAARSRWDELATAAAAVEDEAAAVTALGGVVLALESAAGGPRWRVDNEPLIVLQRRFGHAQRRLDFTMFSVPQLEEHLSALNAAAAGAPQPAAAVVTHAAVHAMLLRVDRRGGPAVRRSAGGLLPRLWTL